MSTLLGKTYKSCETRALLRIDHIRFMLIWNLQSYVCSNYLASFIWCNATYVHRSCMQCYLASPWKVGEQASTGREVAWAAILPVKPFNYLRP